MLKAASSQVVWLFAFVTAVLCEAGQRKFDGFSVLRLNPRNSRQLNFLSQLETDFDNDLTYFQKLDFWKRPTGVNSTVDLMVSPEMKSDLQRIFRANGLESDVVIKDVEK